MSRQYDQLAKFMLIGDSNVGKTSILQQFCNRSHSQHQKTTVCLEYSQKMITISGKRVLVQLWDTAGQQRFRTLTPSFYRSAMGILVVYSVTDKNSFNSVQLWMRQIQQYAQEGIPVLILSNKVDIQERQVSQQQSHALAERHQSQLVMVSAKDNINIDTAIIRLYHKMIKDNRNTMTGSKELKGNKGVGWKMCSC